MIIETEGVALCAFRCSGDVRHFACTRKAFIHLCGSSSPAVIGHSCRDQAMHDVRSASIHRVDSQSLAINRADVPDNEAFAQNELAGILAK